jgi:hypothetical protein
MQAGCPACHAAEPELTKFMSRHPDVLVIRIDARRGREVAGFTAKATPAYLFKSGDDKFKHVDPLKAEDLDDILAEFRHEPDDEDHPEEANHEGEEE